MPGLWPSAHEVQPVFIIGCGRSGTTALGKLLAEHNGVTYLNERRDLWRAAYPATDIWTSSAPTHRGKLVLTAADARQLRSRKLRRLFLREVSARGGPLLVEKLPVNSFRLDFLHAIFPQAKYIHIYRNGLEVAASIAGVCKRGAWFGANDYKWREIARLAEANAETSGLADTCRDDFEKGLLEWRLATEAVLRFLKRQPPPVWLELSYAELSEQPAAVTGKLAAFLSIAPAEHLIEFSTANISRQSPAIEPTKISERQQLIGGPLLPLSFRPTGLFEAQKLAGGLAACS